MCNALVSVQESTKTANEPLERAMGDTDGEIQWWFGVLEKWEHAFLPLYYKQLFQESY